MIGNAKSSKPGDPADAAVSAKAGEIRKSIIFPLNWQIKDSDYATANGRLIAN
jgi:hypothetical protein